MIQLDLSERLSKYIYIYIYSVNSPRSCILLRIDYKSMQNHREQIDVLKLRFSDLNRTTTPIHSKFGRPSDKDKFRISFMLFHKYIFNCHLFFTIYFTKPSYTGYFSLYMKPIWDETICVYQSSSKKSSLWTFLSFTFSLSTRMVL